MSEKENLRLRLLIDKHKKDDEYLSNLDIITGSNNHEAIVQHLSKFGEKVLFCTGSRAMARLGFLQKYLNLFKENGFNVYHYNNISANPTLQQMQGGVTVAKEFNPDFIFALGGGSVIDTAKIISIGFYGDIWDFVEKKAEIEKAIPVIASSTTSGTGSQITPYAVVTNTSTLEKKTLKNLLMLPKLSIVDTDITRSAPKEVIASTGFDVLCHAAEVYTRDDCSPAAREFAKRSLELVNENLMKSYGHHNVLEYKQGMAFADLYAGVALAMIGTHLPHAISHPISAHFADINHGQSLAYVMAETSKQQIKYGNHDLQNKFKEVSRLLGGNNDFVATINNYVGFLNIDVSREFDKPSVDKIVEDTLGYRMSSVKRCPAKLDDEQVTQIINTSLLK